MVTAVEMTAQPPHPGVFIHLAPGLQPSMAESLPTKKPCPILFLKAQIYCFKSNRCASRQPIHQLNSKTPSSRSLTHLRTPCRRCRPGRRSSAPFAHPAAWPRTSSPHQEQQCPFLERQPVTKINTRLCHQAELQEQLCTGPVNTLGQQPPTPLPAVGTHPAHRGY